MQGSVPWQGPNFLTKSDQIRHDCNDNPYYEEDLLYGLSAPPPSLQPTERTPAPTIFEIPTYTPNGAQPNFAW